MKFIMMFQSNEKIISPSDAIKYCDDFFRIINCNHLVEVKNCNSLVIHGDVKDHVYFIRLVIDILYMTSEINGNLLKANLIYTDITTDKEIEIDLLKFKNGDIKTLDIPYENFKDDFSRRVVENKKRVKERVL